MTRRLILSLLVLLLLPIALTAQAPSSYIIGYYQPGAPQPIQTFTFQASAVMCNQPSPAVGTPSVSVNPTKAVWNDPDNAGKVCLWTDPGTGPLFTAPIPGTYEATLKAVNAAGTGPESNRAPFSRLGLPAVLTGFRVTQ